MFKIFLLISMILSSVFAEVDANLEIVKKANSVPKILVSVSSNASEIETLSKMNAAQKKQIKEYTSEYFPNLNFDAELGIFEIGDEEALKNLIFGIEQRFYTTIVGAEKRVANSIQTL